MAKHAQKILPGVTMRRSLLPDLSALQTFECAARHENFSRAAEELNLTQSAVSRQIRDFEDRIGHRLFERVRQRVVLSEAGERLLPQVRRLLRNAEDMMTGALSLSPEQQLLRVGVLPTFGARWLVPRLVDFTATHPGLSLALETRDGPFNFAETSLDLAIHYGQGIWPDAVATYLCNEAVVPVVSRDFAARHRFEEPQDLTGLPLLHMSGRPSLWPDWFAARGLPDQSAWAGMRFDQFALIISAVSAGLGVALLPSYLIEREIAAGDLVALEVAPTVTENSYYVVIPEGRQTNPAALALQSWLLSQVRPQSRRELLKI